MDYLLTCPDPPDLFFLGRPLPSSVLDRFPVEVPDPVIGTTYSPFPGVRSAVLMKLYNCNGESLI